MAGRVRVERRRFRQLRVAAGLHLRYFSETDGRGIRVVPRSRVLGVRDCGDDGSRLLSATRVLPRSIRSQVDHRAFADDLWKRVRIAVAADAAFVAPLCHLRDSWHGRQRNGADGVRADRLELVCEAPWRRARRCHVWRGHWRDGAATGCSVPHRFDWLARRKLVTRGCGAGRRFASRAELDTGVSVRA
jgi:preprotein translocase subunit Sec61beta